MSNSDCIFCKIANKEIKTKLVYENDDFVAFNDIKPVSPTHILVIPKRHIKNLLELDDKDLSEKYFKTIKEIATQAGVSETGFRTIFNTGDNGGQTVYHMHAHILGGRFHTWPPG